MVIDRVEEAVRRAFKKLTVQDGSLFECPVEEDPSPDVRKLHEVCINHKLAIYLEEYLLPDIQGEMDAVFSDIEFNREGGNFKTLWLDGREKTVRPDIIIHNRKSGGEGHNFLVAECKKNTCSLDEKSEDERKLRAFLTDPKYEYSFGLQAIYTNQGVHGTLFFKENGQIVTREIHI